MYRDCQGCPKNLSRRGVEDRDECSKVGEAVSKTAWAGSIPCRPCQTLNVMCSLRGEHPTKRCAGWAGAGETRHMRS